MQEKHEPRGTLTLSSGYRITLKGQIVEALDLPKDGTLIYYIVKMGNEPVVILRRLPSIPMAVRAMPDEPAQDDPDSLFSPET